MFDLLKIGSMRTLAKNLEQFRKIMYMNSRKTSSTLFEFARGRWEPNSDVCENFHAHTNCSVQTTAHRLILNAS